MVSLSKIKAMSIENLQREEAVRKLKDLVDYIDIGMLSTFENGTDYPYSIPMSRQEVDDEGVLWFLFSLESETYRHLNQNNKVSITFADIKDYKFLSINGTAEVLQDEARIEKYWNRFMEAWFEKGSRDSSIRLLKITPSEAHYWDNKTNKLMTLFKVAAGAISGKRMDIGREGDLNV